MNKSRLLIVLAIPTLLLACARPAEDGAIPDAVQTAWADAFNRGDGAAMTAVYAEDGMLLPPNGEPVKGHEAIQAALTGMLAPGMTIDAPGEESVVHGDLAYRRGHYSIKDASGNELDRGKFLEIWRLVNGNWLLSRDMWNSSVPPAAPPAAPAEAAPAPAAS